MDNFKPAPLVGSMSQARRLSKTIESDSVPYQACYAMHGVGIEFAEKVLRVGLDLYEINHTGIHVSSLIGEPGVAVQFNYTHEQPDVEERLYRLKSFLSRNENNSHPSAKS